MRKCIVCQERRTPDAAGMCDPCCRSYERVGLASMAEVIEWAATRAREFERKRIKQAVDEPDGIKMRCTKRIKFGDFGAARCALNEGHHGRCR